MRSGEVRGIAVPSGGCPMRPPSRSRYAARGRIVRGRMLFLTEPAKNDKFIRVSVVF